MVSLKVFSSYNCQMVSCVTSVHLQGITSTVTFSHTCINTISQVGQDSNGKKQLNLGKNTKTPPYPIYPFLEQLLQLSKPL